MATQDDGYPIIIIAVIAGLIVDFLLHFTKVSPENEKGIRIVAGLLPILFFASYFGLLQIFFGEIGWSVDLWAGSVVLASGLGLLLSTIIMPKQQSTT